MAYTRTKDDLPNFTPTVNTAIISSRSAICSPYNLGHATEHGSGEEPPETVAYRLRKVDRASDTIQCNEERTNPRRRRVPIRRVAELLWATRVGGNPVVGHHYGLLVKNERETWCAVIISSSAYLLRGYITLYNPVGPCVRCDPTGPGLGNCHTSIFLHRIGDFF